VGEGENAGNLGVLGRGGFRNRPYAAVNPKISKVPGGIDVNTALLDQVWEAGYTFDAASWPDDMGYKQNQFYSLRIYRNLLKPVHKRAVDWAHAKGVKVLTWLKSWGGYEGEVYGQGPELVIQFGESG
jgi:hypothetical protein